MKTPTLAGRRKAGGIADLAELRNEKQSPGHAHSGVDPFRLGGVASFVKANPHRRRLARASVLGSETRQGTRRGRGPNLQAGKVRHRGGTGQPTSKADQRDAARPVRRRKYDEIRAKWFAPSG